MSTQAPAATETTVDDYDAIAMVVQQYIDGSATGDTSKLEQVFDPDARMYGALGHERIDIPVQELFKMMANLPMGPAYRARITAVHQSGDAAVAVVAEDGCWGSVSFVDFFSLANINGSWKIVNKTFAHTGGTPPGA